MVPTYESGVKFVGNSDNFDPDPVETFWLSKIFPVIVSSRSFKRAFLNGTYMKVISTCGKILNYC